MNLTQFGIQWLQSDDFEKQVHGAKLISGLISVKNARRSSREDSQGANLNTKVSEDSEAAKVDITMPQRPQDDSGQAGLNYQSADSLRKLGTNPGLLGKLVAMLFWKSKYEETLLDEVATIICDVLASDQSCSRFADAPGAVEAVVSLAMTRVDQNLVGHGDGSAVKKWETPLQILRSLAATKSTSGLALRQQIVGKASVLHLLKKGIMDGENCRLQLLSVEILFHLALDENARGSIGATENIILLLFNLFEQSVFVPEHTEISSVEPQTIERSAMAGMVLSRLLVENKANCKTLVGLERGESKVFDRVFEQALLGNDHHLAAIAAEILHRVWACADESTKRIGGRIALTNVVQGEIPDGVLYAASLGLASCAIRELPLEVTEVSREELLQTQFVNRLLENLKEGPTISQIHEPTVGEKEVQIYAVTPQRRYSLEMITALAEGMYLPTAFAKDGLEGLRKTQDSVSGVEDYILLSGAVGCARYPEDMEALCGRAIRAVEAL